MKIIHAPKTIRLITLGNRKHPVAAIYCLFFILIYDKIDYEDTILINHEMIHHAQAKELLFIFFYPFYLLFFSLNLIRYKFNFYKAYKNIPFEKEAYKYEANTSYLQHRKLFNWIK
jgi:hypothetical protein